MKSATTISYELEEEWNMYLEFAYNLAEQVFNEQIKPWLQKKGYCFVAGNGIWLVYDPKKRASLYEDEVGRVPENLLQLLEMEVPGLHSNDLGSLMPNYTSDKE